MEPLTALEQDGEIYVRPAISQEYAEILTPDALRFVRQLHSRFDERRQQLLEVRQARQAQLDDGALPDFLEETRHIREGKWRIAPIPPDLQDRRVEITGPAGDAKMVINAFNSGAKAFMADFEDANSPTWDNTIRGQIYLRDAIRRTLTYTSPEGKHYALQEKIAALIVRPRGWHLEERHVQIGGKPASGSLFDFGLFFYHNAQALLERHSGPYFYLPKLESHLEARLWNDVFVFAQAELGIPQGTIKATVLIETILATFEADEMLYELREHSAGLNCGRWDYLFSYIKKLIRHQDVLLPDRAQVTMTAPFMKAYTSYVIHVCHKRHAHAMGGMAAQIPIKNDPAANDTAIRKVREDKKREAEDGHDGTWVAHPGLVGVAMEVFDELMPEANQIAARKREDVLVNAADLLAVPPGTITEEGLRMNISVALQYIEAWLRGSGAVPLYNLMEDAATAEISRTQVWQWIRHPRGMLEDGTHITLPLVRSIMENEMDRIEQSVGSEKFRQGRYEIARKLLDQMLEEDKFIEFLTVPAYDRLIHL